MYIMLNEVLCQICGRLVSVSTNLRTGFHKPPKSFEINTLTTHPSTISSSPVSRTYEASSSSHHTLNTPSNSMTAHHSDHDHHPGYCQQNSDHHYRSYLHQNSDHH